MTTRMVLVLWHLAVLVLMVGCSLLGQRVERVCIIFCHEGMVAVVLGAFWKGVYRVVVVDAILRLWWWLFCTRRLLPGPLGRSSSARC